MRCCCPTAFASPRTPRARDWTDDILGADPRRSIASSPTRRAATRSTCKGSSSTPTKAAACRSNAISRRRLAEREALTSGQQDIEAVARERGLERQVSRHSVVQPHEPRAVAPAGRPASTLADGQAGRRPGARRRDRRLANRGCGNSPPSATSAKSAGQSAGWSRSTRLCDKQEIRFKVPAATDARRSRRSRSSRPMRGTATSTTSSSGSSRGSWRRAGPTCCCAMCAT